MRLAGPTLLALAIGLPLAAQQSNLDQLNARVIELYKARKFAEAVPVAQEAIKVAEASFEKNHPKIATALNNLAVLYDSQGMYDKAEPLYKQALEIREKALGPNDPAVATTLNDLATMYTDMGQKFWPDAENFLRRALEIRRKAYGSENASVATSLNDLAVLYKTEGKLADAEPLLREALGIWEKVIGPEHPDLATSQNNLAVLYDTQSKYAEAEPLYKRALAIREKALGPEHPSVANTLNDLATMYVDQARFAEAEPMLLRAVAIREKAVGPESAALGVSLNDLGMLYKAEGKYAEAEPLLQRALAIREKIFRPDSPELAVSLNNLAGVYNARGRFNEAEPLLLRALAIREKNLGPDSPALATQISNLGDMYRDRGRYFQAEPLYKRALAIREKALGSDHADVATSLGDLAALYSAEGRYADAEPLYRRALSIQQKAARSSPRLVVAAMNSLALACEKQGKYLEARQLRQDALGIDEKLLNPGHPTVATDLNSLALVYHSLGNYQEAESLLQRSLAIREKELGPDHPLVAVSLNSLADLYQDQGKYAQAEATYQRALGIREKARGPDHPEVAQALINLATVYRVEGKYAQAEPLYRRALDIRKKVLDPENPELASALSSLAGLHMDQGRYNDAEPLLRQALGIHEKSFGAEHPNVAPTLLNLAALHYALGRPKLAEEFFDRSMRNLAKLAEQHFAYMSEKERLEFLDTLGTSFPMYASFCYTYRTQNPALVGKLYDLLLWEKGLVARSAAALRTKIVSSGDKEALSLLDRLTTKKTQLEGMAGWQTSNREEWRKSWVQLEEQADELEQELGKRSPALAEEKKLARATWRDVLKALKPGEAAVELVRFDLHNGRKWTDTSYYAALVLTPGRTTGPRFIVLGEAKKLEGAPLRAYQQHLEATAAPAQRGQATGSKQAASAATAEASFYNAFWKPLAPALGLAKRVFFSPDGVLEKVSLGVVPAVDGRLLMEAYDLRIVSSTRDLLRQRGKAAPQNSAVLIGKPDFALSEVRQRAALRALPEMEKTGRAPDTGSDDDHAERQQRAPLLAAQAELDAFSSPLERRGWNVRVYAGPFALKEAVRRLKGPRLLHLATESFYLPTPTKKPHASAGDQASGLENPLLRSGLYFAGVKRGNSDRPAAADFDDGILTAYEATGLNLQGTELVVLNTSQTGLGTAAPEEGVASVQRALQEAGAEATLVSLWNVPERETQELLALFYEKWLSGKEKHQALRDAQLQMRTRIKQRDGRDTPALWGAFVLIGR